MTIMVSSDFPLKGMGRSASTHMGLEGESGEGGLYTCAKATHKGGIFPRTHLNHTHFFNEKNRADSFEGWSHKGVYMFQEQKLMIYVLLYSNRCYHDRIW